MTEEEDYTMQFLFCTWEGGGNVPTVMTLVRELSAAGHGVRVLGDDLTRREIKAAGGRFLPWTAAPNRSDPSPAADPLRDWDRKPKEVIGFLIDNALVGPAAKHAQDVIDALAAEPADLVVANDLQIGGIMGAEATGTPYAILASNVPLFPRAGVPPLGPGLHPARSADDQAFEDMVRAMFAGALAAGCARYNEERAKIDLPPVARIEDSYDAAEAVLVGSAKAFDYPGAADPANMEWIGPLLGAPVWSAGEVPVRKGDRPLVLASLSTTFQNQGAMLQAIVEGLATLDVDAVVTTGPALAGTVDGRGRVVVAESAPHDALMAEADLVITHCGHGTAMRALVAGKPVLCIPMGRDQNDNAARITWHGAGLRLDRQADAGQIAAAARELLEAPSYRAAATKLGAEIARETDPRRAARRLVALADNARSRAKAA